MPLLTVGQVAKQLDMSEDMVRRMADSGELPLARTRQPGKHRRFSQETVDGFLRKEQQ